MDTNVFLVVLGFGQVESVLNRPTEKRVCCALERARKVLAAGKKVPVLIFTTGGDLDGKSVTMASVMEDYVRKVCRTDGMLTGITIIANKKDPEVWGTVLEAAWGEKEAKRFSGSDAPEMEFVTNCRHARRIRITNRFVMKIQNLRTVESNDPPSCWYHEVLGYGKLALYLTGMTRVIARVEHLRRTNYTAG